MNVPVVPTIALIFIPVDPFGFPGANVELGKEYEAIVQRLGRHSGQKQGPWARDAANGTLVVNLQRGDGNFDNAVGAAVRTAWERRNWYDLFLIIGHQNKPPQIKPKNLPSYYVGFTHQPGTTLEVFDPCIEFIISGEIKRWSDALGWFWRECRSMPPKILREALTACDINRTEVDRIDQGKIEDIARGTDVLRKLSNKSPLPGFDLVQAVSMLEVIQSNHQKATNDQLAEVRIAVQAAYNFLKHPPRFDLVIDEG